MRIRTAIMTGVTGLMITGGLGSSLFAQPVYGYRNSPLSRRYAARGQAAQMVRQAYRDILRREPDPSGLQEYTDAILNRGWSDSAVRRSLLNSPEYAQRFGAARSGWRPRYR